MNAGIIDQTDFLQLPPTSQRFAAVIMRLTKPKSTALVFESGKMVVLGAKTTNDVRKNVRSIALLVLDWSSSVTPFLSAVV